MWFKISTCKKEDNDQANTCRSFILSGMVLLISLLFSVSIHGQHPVSLRSRLQGVLDSVVMAAGVPGATFAAILPSGEIISIASGLADQEESVPMRPGDCMLTGSVGKTFVAATVLKLVGENRLSLDDSVGNIFTGQKWYQNLPNGKDITVRMLLNHTSGIPEYVYDTAIWSALSTDPDKIWTGEERLQFSCRQAALFPAGKGWSYADANYILLGMIIEKVTNRDFYDVVRDYFIAPLKLDHTKPANRRDLGCLVAGYTGMSEELRLPRKMIKEGKYAFNPQVEWTGGGFVSNVTDLAMWAMHLFGGTVLTDTLKKLMLQPSDPPATLPGNTEYGLGVIISHSGGLLSYGHSGFAPGYITVVQYLPAFQVALALQVNSDEFRTQREAAFIRLREVVIASR